MENNNINPNSAVFSGFAGGHDTIPGQGNVPPATTGVTNPNISGSSQLGASLPHVDPNNFPGVVHWGPESVVSGAQVQQLPTSQANKDS
ncbi:unnamed protein product [Adineta steineri]|uniref:Uncharacterized protein n=1 Tax=Adineta steineri TaxID=433720 RepID=A0A820F2P5_9BILA|nr:unnamed protein product [Adineta steineri]CAF4293110.1 unnamed protein product [Adineta steineri]